MATFVLVPGAGGDAYYWDLVVDELQRRGHGAVAVELPSGDESAGLAAYADAIVAAADGRGEVVVVAQSMGGLSAPLACDRLPVELMVLVNAMVPRPGETGGDWWGATGQREASAEQAERDGREPGAFDVMEMFFHDVPEDVTSRYLARGEPPQSGRPFEDPWPLPAWPDVPTRVLASSEDRLFPLAFQSRVARERLGLEVEVLPGGHCVALSQPVALVDRLEAYARG